MILCFRRSAIFFPVVLVLFFCFICSSAYADNQEKNITAEQNEITSESQKLCATIEEFTDRLSDIDGIVPLNFESGSFRIVSGTIDFFDRNDRIRINNQESVALSIGDVIHTSHGTEFYLAYTTDNGQTWTDLNNWYTNYNVETNADYLIMLRDADNPSLPVEDISVMTKSLHITRNDSLAMTLNNAVKQSDNTVLQLNKAIDRMNQVADGITSIASDIGTLNLDYFGSQTISNLSFVSITDFQTIVTFDAVNGGTYDFQLTLSEPSTGYVFIYLLDASGKYIQSNGSLAYIFPGDLSVAFSIKMQSAYNGVRLALKTNTGCILSSVTISSDYFALSRIRAIEQELNVIYQLEQKDFNNLQQKIFELTGLSDVKNVEIAQGSLFTTLFTINLKPRIQYTMTLDIVSPIDNGMIFAYLLDSNGHFAWGDGSLLAIEAGKTSASTTFILDEKYNNLQFAVRCPASGFTVETASISFVPEGDDSFLLPDYYFDGDYLNGKINRINELAKEAGADGDVFFFITDEHIQMNTLNSPALIKYISDRTHVTRLFDGGDASDMGSDSWPNVIRKAMNGKVYFVMGNHEWFGNQTGNALYYTYDSANNEQIGNASKHYYYVDDVQVRTRYIVLSSFGESQYDESYTGISQGFDSEQLSWLQNTALDVDSDWTIIIFTHALFYGDFETHTWYALDFAQDFFDIVDNYSGKGKIAFIMQGHLHADGINYTPGGIPVIATACDKQDHWIRNGIDMEEFLSGRKKGTTSEQAFDVVIHNKRTKTIYCVRVGGFSTFDGKDMVDLNTKGERVFTYE